VRIISVINQKGGVGKTTTAMNIAHALSLTGKKVLIVDMDPQSHLTTSLGILERGQVGIDGVLRGDCALQDVMQEVRKKLFVIPAGEKLAEFEFISEPDSKRGFRLKEALENDSTRFDFVIIDCPPSAGLLGMNALLAAKELLIPVSSDFLSLQGLSRLMGIIKHIEGRLGLQLKKWLVVTRYQSRRRLAKDVVDKLLEHFPRQVLQTRVRESVSLAESPSFGQTIFDYRNSSSGASDYEALALDLAKRRTLNAA
jgi:chromosome partitioning protein